MTAPLNDVARIATKEFNYMLPAGRIALHPLPVRDASKLLVYRKGGISDAVFRDIHHYIDPGSLMLLNNTRVVQARLEFFKASGARIEILCLHPVVPSKDVSVALGHASPSRWYCLVGNAKKWKQGTLEIRYPEQDFVLYASLEQRYEDGYLVNFSWEPSHLDFARVLELAGQTPLPPYIARKAEESDRSTYQTVFSRDAGSVAAPTAGLHFTGRVFDTLRNRGVVTEFLTLHVGAGTFKPVTSDTIGSHLMHQEQFQVDLRVLEGLASHKGPVISVGTTSLRTLESVYWLGVGLLKGHHPSGDVLKLSQWTPYESTGPLPSRNSAIGALTDWMKRENMMQVRGETALIIVPGYEFKMTDVLTTNFHQPGSTLLLLVAAFVGKDWKMIYRHALDNDYRFLSYGDGCLFFRS